MNKILYHVNPKRSSLGLLEAMITTGYYCDGCTFCGGDKGTVVGGGNGCGEGWGA